LHFRYNKLAERIDDKMGKSGSLGQDSLAEDLVVIMVFVYDMTLIVGILCHGRLPLF
jgi:hypothetical protein